MWLYAGQILDNCIVGHQKKLRLIAGQ